MTIDTPEAPFRPSFYSPETVSDEEADLVLDAIAREVEREAGWHEEYGQRFPAVAFAPFKDRDEIYYYANHGYLSLVESNDDFKLIPSLENEYKGYSPPYLRPQVHEVLLFIARATMEEFDPEERFRLSITSLVRDEEYQADIADDQPRRPAVGNMGKPNGAHSSHEYGLAFDIDGSGHYHGDRSVHPRKPGYDEDYNVAIHERLKLVLSYIANNTDLINVVNELPGYSEEVFHVAVNPNILDHKVEDVRQLLAPLAEVLAKSQTA